MKKTILHNFSNSFALRKTLTQNLKKSDINKKIGIVENLYIIMVFNYLCTLHFYIFNIFLLIIYYI